MIQVVSPFQFSKSICVPASKSVLQRLIALSTFCEETSMIKNVNYCDDVKAAINVAKTIGAEIQENADYLEIKGIPHPQNKSITINVNESGLCARMFSLILPVFFENVIIEGNGTLLDRNMHSVINILNQAGCNVTSNHHRLPLIIEGIANYQNISLQQIDSSQIITGLLYAAALSRQASIISLTNVVSVPYIQLSLHIAQQFGLQIIASDEFKSIYIPANQIIRPISNSAEGDWSNAAFFLVAGALSGKAELYHLNPASFQGDKIIVEILKQCGAYLYWNSDILIVEKSALKPFEVDLTHYPDLFPPLSILAAGIKGTSRLSGISRLINKESQRDKAILKMLETLGVEAKIEDDTMFINGKEKVNGGIIHSFNDHRIAMAAATAATIANSPITIVNTEAVNKSYPNFFNDFLN
ncbi:MAG: 3-phosphoshikimate 1-carboxyvinyltransferase [Bacteroidia bacterium]|nr:MAG: 3-phosphoshikimate 1-carboxyvinyltransferase [Bacteroidia bacterium]